MDIEKFQEIMDKNKIDMSENIYLQLSNMCLSYNENNENEEIFYEITYLYQKYSIKKKCFYETITKNNKEIVKITQKKALSIIKCIEDNGYFEDENCLCDRQHSQILSRHGEIEIIYLNNKCRECGEYEILKTCIKNNPIIVKIKKA
jgi:hypothetical protein